MTARTRLRLTMVIGIVLSVPAIRLYLDGGIPIDSAAIRVAVAMAFAAVAVTGLKALLDAYTPEPEEAPPEQAIEDADLVDDDDDGAALEEPPL